MMIYISCAKTMTSRSRQPVPFTSLPRFQAEAGENALHLSRFTPEELSQKLRIPPKLAAENYLRYQDFWSETPQPLPALLSYTGIVFKRIHPEDFTEADFRHAQEHLLIASFLYGLLRPLDLIKTYRLEGDVKLAEHGDATLFDYWKPKLTDFFVQTIREQGGVLINLASSEMKNLLDWQRVCRETRVVTPEFRVMKNGKPSTVVIYAKMCRGEMTRHLIKHRAETPEAIQAFEWEGFAYDKSLSTPDKPVFVLG